MSDINKEMQEFALRVKEEATEKGYMLSICLADGLGHGEFYYNIEDVNYSMIRIIKKKGKQAIHFKAHMQSEPIKTNMSVNALAILSDIVGFNAMSFIEMYKSISDRIKIDKENGKIIPFEPKDK